MSFDMQAFLKEWGGEFNDSGSKGEVLQMVLQPVIGVFAGKQSKAFPVKNQKLAAIVKKEADKYAATLDGNPKVTGAVEQIWYTPILGREKQPKWEDGEWHDMQRRVVVNINGEWQETGLWNLFKSQWIADNAPLSEDDFGKKLWVHAVYKPHPDFNKDAPDKYTAQTEDGAFRLNQNGEPMPQYVRVVAEVIGESREEAEAWYAEHIGGEAGGNTAESDESAFEDELMALRDKLPAKDQESFDDATWMDCVKTMFNSVHESGNAEPDWSGWIDVGMNEDVINGVKELAAKYPPF